MQKEVPVNRGVTDRRAQILQTAGEMFAAQGYLATSMRELAEAIGIEAASIYSHFPSKESLLQTVAWQLADAFLESAEAVYESNLPPAEKLRGMLVAHIEVIAAHQSIAGVFLTEWKHLSPELLSDYLAQRDAYENMFRRVVDAGMRSGAFLPTDPKLVSLILLSAVNMTARWLDAQGPMELQTLSQRIADLLLGGILTPATTPAVNA